VSYVKICSDTTQERRILLKTVQITKFDISSLGGDTYMCSAQGREIFPHSARHAVVLLVCLDHSLVRPAAESRHCRAICFAVVFVIYLFIRSFI